ncbi:MAG: hypothetical protein Q7J59_05120 [Elusimicrobiota bacterium]|nr:hypothetical protein [Elusimicrobiota bacterium]
MMELNLRKDIDITKEAGLMYEKERFSYIDNEDFNAENRWLLTLQKIIK